MGSKGCLIGEAAERAGLSADTLRYYERVGVIPRPQRTESGYRLYDERDLERLEFIRQSQALGLSLEEIGEILEMAEAGIEPCEHVSERLRQRVREVETRIAELGALRARLRSALARAEEAPARGSCRCRIIEGSAQSRAEGTERVPPRRGRRPSLNRTEERDLR